MCSNLFLFTWVQCLFPASGNKRNSSFTKKEKAKLRFDMKCWQGDSKTQALLLSQPREAFPITILLPTQLHSLLRAGSVNLSWDAPSAEGACAELELILSSVWHQSISLGLHSGVQEIPSWPEFSFLFSKDTSDTWAVILVHLLFMLGGKPAEFLWLKDLENQQNCKKVLALSLLFRYYFYLRNNSLKETRNHCLKSCWDLLSSDISCTLQYASLFLPDLYKCEFWVHKRTSVSSTNYEHQRWWEMHNLKLHKPFLHLEEVVGISLKGFYTAAAIQDTQLLL